MVMTPSCAVMILLSWTALSRTSPGGFPGNNRLCSLGSMSLSVSGASVVPGRVTKAEGGRTLKLRTPKAWIEPESIAMKARNRTTSNPVSGFEKKFEAIRDRNNGERPNKAIVTPDAIPMCLGKFFDAQKRNEKYLERVVNYCRDRSW